MAVDLSQLTQANVQDLLSPEKDNIMVTGVPVALKRKLEADAEKRDISVAALVRLHVANAYNYDLDADAEAEKSRKTTRNAVLDALMKAAMSGKIKLSDIVDATPPSADGETAAATS